jgi:hypothetical protein
VVELRDPTAPNAPSEVLPSRQPATSDVQVSPSVALADETPDQDADSVIVGEEKRKPGPSVQSIVFAEFFSGEGNLTKTMRRSGVRCLEPDDFAAGGTDFSDKAQVMQVRHRLREIRTGDEKTSYSPCASLSYLFPCPG